MLRREREDVDLVHAFGGAALAAAALGTRLPIVSSPVAETRARTIHWLRAVMSYRNVQVICATATQRRRMVERGVPLERCHLVRPGVEFARIRRRRNAEQRARLGLSNDDHVYLAAGESTRGAAHTDAVWACGILHLLDERKKLLIWGRGPMTGAVERFAKNVGQEKMLRVAEARLGRVEFEELLAAADTVLVPARAPVATLPIAIAMAAGLPIVAAVTYTVSELLEDRHTALMTAKGKPREMARRILDLAEDSALQWSIADMARTEAYEYFAFTRFVNQFRTVYRQFAAGEKVDVPQEGPGAGLRFHGRA